MIKCTKCGILKEQTEFSKDKQKKTGHRPDCRACNTKRCGKWVNKNPEQRKLNVLKSTTGVTKEDYLGLLEMQEFRCAICRKSIKENGRNLSVDHCHIMNIVRGLLCTKCNFGIGYFNDDPDLMRKGISYLNNNYSFKNIKHKENGKKIKGVAPK